MPECSHEAFTGPARASGATGDQQLDKVRIELFRLPIGGSRETDRPLLPKSRRRRAIEAADVALRGKNLE